jgi:predicted adenylyl cyclase CyaB
MLEIEQKFEVASFQELEKKLASRNVRLAKEEYEVDHYLNAPDRDFAKRPKLDSKVKMREEIEVPIPAGEIGFQDHLKVFLALGYKFVARVSKRRRTYSLNIEGFDIAFSLDEVETLGLHVEVEIVAEEQDSTRAIAVVQKLSEELGLKQVQPKSYLRLVLEKMNG